MPYEDPPSVDEALAIVDELAAVVPERTKVAIGIVLAHARRGRRISQTSLQAVGHVMSGAQSLEVIRRELGECRAELRSIDSRLGELEKEVVRGADSVAEGTRELRVSDRGETVLAAEAREDGVDLWVPGKRP